jgi:hypothetical protein
MVKLVMLSLRTASRIADRLRRRGSRVSFLFVTLRDSLQLVDEAPPRDQWLDPSGGRCHAEASGHGCVAAESQSPLFRRFRSAT